MAEKLRHRAGDAVPPRIVQFGERGGEFSAGGLHRQLVAADFTDLHGRNAHELGAFNDFHGVERFAGNDNARLRLAEEQGVQPCRTGIAPVSELTEENKGNEAWSFSLFVSFVFFC